MINSVVVPAVSNICNASSNKDNQNKNKFSLFLTGWVGSSTLQQTVGVAMNTLNSKGWGVTLYRRITIQVVGTLRLQGMTLLRGAVLSSLSFHLVKAAMQSTVNLRVCVGIWSLDRVLSRKSAVKNSCHRKNKHGLPSGHINMAWQNLPNAVWRVPAAMLGARSGLSNSMLASIHFRNATHLVLGIPTNLVLLKNSTPHQIVEKAASWSFAGALGKWSCAKSWSNFFPSFSPLCKRSESVSWLSLGTTSRKSSSMTVILALTPNTLATAVTASDWRCAIDVQDEPPKGKYGLNQKLPNANV